MCFIKFNHIHTYRIHLIVLRRNEAKPKLDYNTPENQNSVQICRN